MDDHKGNGNGDLLPATSQQHDTIISMEQDDAMQRHQKKRHTKLVRVMKVKAFLSSCFVLMATANDVQALQVTALSKLTRQCGLIATAGLLQACEGTPMLHAAVSSYRLLPTMLIKHCGSCIGS